MSSSPTRRPVAAATAVLAGILLSACAQGFPSSAPAPSPLSHQLTVAELQGTPGTSLHQAIARVRPAFLRDRRSGTGRQPTLVLDGLRQSSFAVLEELRVEHVAHVQFHEAYEARFRWGTPGAVLEVRTVPASLGGAR